MEKDAKDAAPDQGERKRRMALVICKNTHVSWGYSAKWNKPDRERQTPYDFTYIWNITSKISEQTTQKETYVDIGNTAEIREGKIGEGGQLYGDGNIFSGGTQEALQKNKYSVHMKCV